MIDDVKPKQLFLIDAVGAITSASMHGFVLAGFNEFFGMPVSVLLGFAALAGLFACYSFVCYLVNASGKYLQPIAAANVLFCCLTLVAILWFYKSLTGLAWVYFLSEIAIVIPLAVWEWKISKK